MKYTGKAVVPSTLRSSFVTYSENQPLPEDLKKSIASSMRHTRETVRRHASCACVMLDQSEHDPMVYPTINIILFPYILQALQDYDRRTRLDRSQRGHKHAEDMLKQALSGTPLGAATQRPAGDGQGREDKGAVPPPSSSPLPSLESAHGPRPIGTAEPADPDEEEPLEAGEVVAVVRGDSTVTAPHITFGRVIKVDREHALISTFEEVSKNVYAFKIGVGSRERVRLVDIVTPIDMVYNESNNSYHLRTPKTGIHLSKSPLL